VYLGHEGRPCRLPARCELMTIMHSNGFHNISVTFCGCASDIRSAEYQNQLLRVQLFPASTDSPKTAFTFAALDLLHHLLTQGKISTYNFYNAMRNVTDAADLEGWPVSLTFTSPISFNLTDRTEPVRGAQSRHTEVQALTLAEAGRSRASTKRSSNNPTWATRARVSRMPDPW
jgi:hypothetical protein